MPLLAAIGVAPRRTMRWMLDHPARRWSFLVVAAAVTSMLLSDFNAQEFGKAVNALGIPNSVVVAVLVVINVSIASVVVFFGLAATATAAGRLLGGMGTFGGVRTAVAWGFAPHVWALLYRVPVLLFWPEVVGAGRTQIRVGSESLVLNSMNLTGGVVAYAVVEVAVLVWYLVVGSRALAEAQGISSWRGFANLLLAVVLPFVVIAVIAAAAILAVKTS